MANTVPSRTSSTLVNSHDDARLAIEPRCAKASIVCNRQSESAPIACSDDAISLVFETLAEIGMSDKEAAYEMAMDPAQLSRVKTRQARLPIDALWRLPDRFWFAFRGRVDAARGLSVESARRARVARIRELVALLIEEVA